MVKFLKGMYVKENILYDIGRAEVAGVWAISSVWCGEDLWQIG